MKLTRNDYCISRGRMSSPAIWALYKRLAVLEAEHGDSGDYYKGSVVHW